MNGNRNGKRQAHGEQTKDGQTKGGRAHGGRGTFPTKDNRGVSSADPHDPHETGQFEIMGLAVIVILVTLGMLFALSTLSGEDSNLQQTFEQKRLAGDFIKASLDTQAPACAKATFRELFQDCASARTIRCTKESGAEQNACKFLKEAYRTLFINTIEAYRTKYLFKVEGPCVGDFGRQLCDITQGNIGSASSPQSCPAEREISSQPLPTRTGTVTLTLEICG